MKTIVRMTASLTVGIAIGWTAGYLLPAGKEKRDGGHQLTKMEAADSIAALTAMRAIPLVESGDAQKAVAFLARPIGNYYRVYGSKAGTNAERLHLRSEIEQLAKSNATVAAEISRKID